MTEWDSASSYPQGTYVVVTDGNRELYARATVPEGTLNTAAQWLDLATFPTYNVSTTYQPGATVINGGRLYYLNGTTAVVGGTFPGDPTSGPWIPYYEAGVAYAFGHLTYAPLHTAVFVRHGNVDNAEPEATNSTGEGWLRVWEAGRVASAQGMFVWYAGLVYMAWTATDVIDRPEPYTTVRAKWVPVWAPAKGFQVGGYVTDGRGLFFAYSER